MKLGEALARRAELQTRLSQMSGRIRATVVAQEGSEPTEDPNDLLVEVEEVAAELERLIATINATNSVTPLESGPTLTEALARRDVLEVRRKILDNALEAAQEGQYRYGRSEIKMVRLLDSRETRRRRDDLARQLRELDAQIQQQNWTVDLVES